MGPSLDAWTLTVPTRLRISHAVIRYSHHLLVRLGEGDTVGWGSAPLYARAPHELPTIFRAAVAPALARAGGDRGALVARLRGFPDVLSALDGALLDLEARQRGDSVARLLGASSSVVRITEQIFAVDAEIGARELRAILARGVRRVKVKVVGRPSADVGLVAALREVAGDDVHLRVDANRAYVLETALAVAPQLAAFGVQVWEEPLRGPFSDVAAFRAETGNEVILDESVRSLADLEAALAARALDVLNLKLNRLGGITAASAYRKRCSEAGVETVIGCAEDLGPAMAAILHAAAAWGPRETEGLGWMRLGLDLASPSPVVRAGVVHLPDGPGWGIDVSPEVELRNGRRDALRLVHHDEWGRTFVVRSWMQRQEQRLSSLVARARRITNV